MNPESKPGVRGGVPDGLESARVPLASATDRASGELPPGVIESFPERRDSTTDAHELTYGSPRIPAGTIVAGRYEVRELLGEGAMGAVYRAEHVHMRKPFAVKVLHRELTLIPEVVARFEREAVAAGLIDHPNVARAHDFGKLDDGTLYLVLEFVQGRSLSAVLEAEGPLELGRALIITRQIAEALMAAHEAGVVHRDLKPDNVMLVERWGARDFVKVLDFGIAKLESKQAGPALTRLGTVFGTPHYMAPEQAAGQTVDHRADLYTLGVMLYEMLCGQVPFSGDDLGSVIMRQITEAPPPLPQWIDPAVTRLTMTQLSKQAEARIGSAAEVVEELDVVMGRLSLVAPGSIRVSRAPLPHTPVPAVEAPRPAPMPRDLLRSVQETAGQVASSGVTLSRGALGGAAAGILALGLLTGALVGRAVAPAAPAEPLPAAAGDAPRQAAPAPLRDKSAELQALIARAATGDKDAVEELGKRPALQRDAQEWLALARGMSELGRTGEALDAYEGALRLDPQLARDRSLLRHVRAAANNRDTNLQALGIAERQLGSAGADILYDVWVATRAKTDATSVAKAMVYGEDVRKKASPALNVVLDLREAQTCEQYKELLPQVATNGDTRALRVLTRLKEMRGCGTLQREDCWPCLRGSEELDNAFEAARGRPEPRF